MSSYSLNQSKWAQKAKLFAQTTGQENHNIIREFSDKLIQKTLELDGTITGEHGIGLNKKKYLIRQHKDNIPFMQMIKKSIDPKNIMNPGKIFDLN